MLGANDVLQHMLAPFIRVRHFAGLVSLWDLQVPGEDGPAIDYIDLDRTAFCGCGGVASATGWSLALHRLRGSPLLVDPDAIDDEGTNLNRHLTASFQEIGVPKARLLQQMLDGAGASSSFRIERWNHQHSDLADLVVVSPDHDGVRRQVQLDLPRVVLAGGTGDDGTFRVARHEFPVDACAGCLWRGDLTDRSPVEGAARALGLDAAILEEYVESQDPLPAEILEAISDEAIRADISAIPGRRLLEHVCAEIRVSPTAPALSAPMLAAAPGILLTTELIKERLGSVTPLRRDASTLTGTVLGGPHSRWISRRTKRPGCECTDPLYIEHYRRKWGGEAGALNRERPARPFA